MEFPDYKSANPDTHLVPSKILMNFLSFLLPSSFFSFSISELYFQDYFDNNIDMILEWFP